MLIHQWVYVGTIKRCWKSDVDDWDWPSLSENYLWHVSQVCEAWTYRKASDLALKAAVQRVQGAIGSRQKTRALAAGDWLTVKQLTRAKGTRKLKASTLSVEMVCACCMHTVAMLMGARSWT